MFLSPGDEIMTVRTTLKHIVAWTIKCIFKFAYHDVQIYKAKFRRRFLNSQGVVVSDGARTHSGGVYAIFLIWQPKALPWYVRNALDALDDAGINVICVVNHDLTEERLRELSGLCKTVIVRGNAGFDIGGYKDATIYMFEGESPRRLLYLNDSVYFFREGLTEMFKRLATSDADIAGTFENWEYTYHIQSFCFSVSNRIFQTREFVDFWNDYLPVNSRLWAINNGEIGLSRAIVPIAHSIEAIFSPNQIRDHLSKMSMDEIVSLNAYICFGQRLSVFGHKGIPKSVLISEICNRIALRSQIHTGGFLYRRYLRSPLMKRDLLYRLQFSIYEIEKNLTDVGHEGHLSEILSEMKRKGLGSQLPLFKRIRFSLGVL